MENVKRTPHKWSKEIEAWANGHQVEKKCRNDDGWYMNINSIAIFDDPDCKFRIYDPLREVKEAFERGELIQGKMKNFHRWENYDESIITIDLITEKNGWEWRVKPKEDLKVGDWVTSNIDFKYKDGVGIKNVFKVENIINHLTFHTSDGIFYKTDFRKATKQEVLNAPNYDGTATYNDFEIEVGDWVGLSVSEPFEVDNSNLEHFNKLREPEKGAFMYATKKEIEKSKAKNRINSYPLTTDECFKTKNSIKTGRNSYMRATGRTTRLINEAIEQLFLYGKILVPINGQYKKITAIGNYIGFPIIIEQDRTDDNTQKELFDKIIARLELEHKGQFDVEKTTIKLKDRE